MTKNEFQEIYNKAIKELSDELTDDKIREILSKDVSEHGYNAAIINSVGFSIQYSQKLVFKVLEMALTKDSTN